MEDYCIWDSEYIENISLKELQPPQLRTVCCVLFGSLLHVLYDSTLLSFFSPFILSSLFFFLKFFFLCCLLTFTRFQFYFLLVLTISFFFLLFFFSQTFSYGYFSTFQIYVSQHFFFWTQLIFHLLGLLIQFSSYFIISNVILFDFVLNIKTCTIVQNFRICIIDICTNLSIVVIFVHSIFRFVFM